MIAEYYIFVKWGRPSPVWENLAGDQLIPPGAQSGRVRSTRGERLREQGGVWGGSPPPVEIFSVLEPSKHRFHINLLTHLELITVTDTVVTGHLDLLHILSKSLVILSTCHSVGAFLPY